MVTPKGRGRRVEGIKMKVHSADLIVTGGTEGSEKAKHNVV